MQDIQDERDYFISVAVPRCIALGFLGSHCGTGKWCCARDGPSRPCARAGVRSSDVLGYGADRDGKPPSLWLSSNKKGPCHDLPRINGKITRNTMKYWDNSWFVASDIWFFRFVLCIPPDYVKPLKRIDWKQDTLPIWWLKQGRLRSSANYVFTIFLEKDIQSLQMPEHDFPIDPLSSSLLSWAEVFGEAKQQKREEVGPWIGR